MPAPPPYLPGRSRMPFDIPGGDQQPPQGQPPFPQIPPVPGGGDPRDQLAQLIAMQQGNHPMGGQAGYGNDFPNAPFVPQLPQGWQPPGAPPLTGIDPSGGTSFPPQPPMYQMPIPKFYTPPGYHLRSTEGNVT